MDIQLTLLFKGECRAGVCFCKFWMHHMHILSLLSTSNVYKMCLTLYSHYKNIEYAWRVNIKTIPSHKNPGSEIPGTITAFSPLHKHNMHAWSILVWIMKPKENNPTDTSFSFPFFMYPVDLLAPQVLHVLILTDASIVPINWRLLYL